MHCKAFFEPPSNHLRITSEQPKTQKARKYGENSIHYAFIIMHYALNYAFIIMHYALNYAFIIMHYALNYAFIIMHYALNPASVPKENLYISKKSSNFAA